MHHESKENTGEGTPLRALSRRDFLIGAGLGVSGLLVAGGAHYMNNLPDSAVEGFINRTVAVDQK
jgi:hypothetical protein